MALRVRAAQSETRFLLRTGHTIHQEFTCELCAIVSGCSSVSRLVLDPGYAGEMTEKAAQPGVALHSFAAHSAAAVRFVPAERQSTDSAMPRPWAPMQPACVIPATQQGQGSAWSEW